ncbi:MAG: anti-anti-sigma factor [Moraxellaceae bacterium]|nr:MAG: anti-anti-sigma factor [Moraxellaceae bacterium]
MLVESVISKDNEELVIKITGDFNFDMMQDFRASYINTEVSSYIVDLQCINFNSAAALGMLFGMRKTLGELADISIINCSPKAKSFLLISRFNELFTIR